MPRIAAGDQTAVAECLARYGGLVWSLAKRRLATSSDAEDAVQEIFVDIWRSAARFNPEVASEVTYVAMIARRRLIDRQRKVDRQIKADPLPVADQVPSASLSPCAVELGEEAALARQGLAELRPEERRVLELSIYEGYSHSKIAEATGLALGTVKTHARRGLTNLRNLLIAGMRAFSGHEGGAP